MAGQERECRAVKSTRRLWRSGFSAGQALVLMYRVYRNDSGVQAFLSSMY